MASLVKSNMKKITGRKTLTQEELQALTTDIETVMNCRAITPLSVENAAVLRPIYFLLPQNNSSPGVFRSLEDDAQDATYPDPYDIHQKLLNY
ncbi:unnamed protein product [Toxocara canis]|uniref:Guanine nucleotide-binding protein subunit gamma n=1 Tax=Toxocara canis TaxID=6265 RepID=A0A183UPN2_TOXCA|nr:unnamed protein product [Toxocara canis]